MPIWSLKVPFNEMQEALTTINSKGGKVVSVFPYSTYRSMFGYYTDVVVIVYHPKEQ